MITSRLIQPSSGSPARERSVRSTRLQERLDATAGVLGVEEANRDVEQQRVGSGDPAGDGSDIPLEVMAVELETGACS
jgi:hypothetical protein